MTRNQRHANRVTRANDRWREAINGMRDVYNNVAEVFARYGAAYRAGFDAGVKHERERVKKTRKKGGTNDTA